MRLIKMLCVSLLVLFQGETVFGQEQDPAKQAPNLNAGTKVESASAENPSPEKQPSEVESAATSAQSGIFQKDLEELRNEMSLMKKEYDAKFESMKAEYDAKLEEAEMADLGSESEETEDRDMKIFGFYDLAFMWRHLDDDSFVSEDMGLINTKPQFLMQHLNLYFSSQMTETLSFLTELQFTFLPNGSETSIWTDQDIVRENTSVNDPYTQNKITLGGLVIQRAYLQWQPFDFFGVKAGYYLTPYGIWHEDHGSPVRLSILPPFENDTSTPSVTKAAKPVPDGQLGLVLFGRAFPSQHLRFDYAFTVSNGRGPADTVIDYDNNKGLGLRLKLTYSRSKVEVALGVYGYYGEYTDRTMPNMGYTGPLIVDNHQEYVLAADLLLAIYGVRLQAEYIRNLVLYKDGVRPEAAFSTSGVATENIFMPDFAGNFFYFLFGYQLPLNKLLGDMTLTPYIGWEYVAPGNYINDLKIKTVWFGLNFKPSYFVTLKVEGSRNVADVQTSIGAFAAKTWTVAGQLAVSF
jgi:hypothetical protein